MDFLKQIGIDDKVILAIKENNTKACLLDLECNQEECLRIIDFMRKIGIKKIDELLIFYTDIFMQTLDSFMKKIAVNDIIKLIDDINLDVSLIEDYNLNF